MVLRASPPTVLTVHDLEALPETDDRLELLDGELIRMPPPQARHSRVSGKAFLRLGRWVEDNDLGFVGNDAGFLIQRGQSESLVAPDLYFIAKDRLPADWDAPGYYEVIPDLVIEVLSPNDRASATQAKVELYLAAGVRLLWIVNPDQRSVTVWTHDRRATLLIGDATLDGGDVLPGFTLPLSQLFE